MANDTIAAVSTPFGEGAISVVRLSGPGAVGVADAVFRGKRSLGEESPRSAVYGSIERDGQTVDRVVATVFRGPASYTGEDVVEISCHGGILVTREVLSALLAAGARSAEPGEFTQRAFLNGKMDLTRAEAVMDLITAQTTLAMRSATEQLEGALGKRLDNMREALIGVTAHLEAYIDFPEEDIDPAVGNALAGKVREVREEAASLLATADQGRVLREGVRTVIFGEPNVGKSSLLNLLLGFDRAIVNARPGTTRDTIEEVVNVLGIPLRLADTAGLRESADEVEQEGMERTRKRIEAADLAIEVVDGSQPYREPATVASCPVLWVVNKSDLGAHESWRGLEGVRLSCRSGEGLDTLRQAIFEKVSGGCGAWDGGGVAINARHRDCLLRVRDALAEAEKQLVGGEMPELTAVSLREALAAVGEVSGRVDADEVLGRIFGMFCIGK